MSRLNIRCKLLDKDFFAQFGIPSFATPGSAGIDLRANLGDQASLTIQPGQTILLNTGMAIFINNPKYAGFIYPRSGHGHKLGLVLGNLVGVVDSDYQGEIKVSLWNRSDEPRTIEHGERIAQLVVQRISRVKIDFVDEFESTERAANGFGSTGKN